MHKGMTKKSALAGRHLCIIFTSPGTDGMLLHLFPEVLAADAQLCRRFRNAPLIGG